MIKETNKRIQITFTKEQVKKLEFLETKGISKTYLIQELFEKNWKEYGPFFLYEYDMWKRGKND